MSPTIRTVRQRIVTLTAALRTPPLRQPCLAVNNKDNRHARVAVRRAIRRLVTIGMVLTVMAVAASVGALVAGRSTQAQSARGGAAAENERRAYEEAFRLARISADGGDPYRAGSLSSLYEWGRGTAVDKAEAMRWRELAAERGSEASQYYLDLVRVRG